MTDRLHICFTTVLRIDEINQKFKIWSWQGFLPDDTFIPLKVEMRYNLETPPSILIYPSPPNIHAYNLILEIWVYTRKRDDLCALRVFCMLWIQ